MSGPVFDPTLDPMADLTLKMADDLEPMEEEDHNEPDVREVEECVKPLVDRKKDEIFVCGRGTKPDEMIDTTGVESIVNDETNTPPIARVRGERGKDKKKRKKRQMTPAALEKLRLAREKSLAVRRKKKADKLERIERERVARARNKRQERASSLSAPKENIKLERKEVKEKIVPPKPSNVFGDFDKFCNFMDRYDERKRKKHTTSKVPHPNRKLPERQRPRPPIQQVQRAPQFRTTGGRRNKSPPPGDFSPYSLLKSGRRSVFGSGMGNSNNYGGGW
jgi:hypothetical protein